MLSRTCNAKTSLCNKGLFTQSYGISNSHALCESDLKEGWVLKNWCFWTVVLDKTLESRLYGKEIKPVNLKGNESWIFIGRTEAEDETPILCLPVVKSCHWKRPWCWERLKAGGEWGYRGWDGWMASATQWTWVWANSGDSEIQGSLACCSPWGHRVGHNLATEQQFTYVNRSSVAKKLQFILFICSNSLCILWSSVNGEINLLFKTDSLCCEVWLLLWEEEE